MNNNVFINCPFDDIYIPLFDSILFSIYFCNFKPRCALEVEDGTQNRLEKIYNIIDSKLPGATAIINKYEKFLKKNRKFLKNFT
ncbi:MAG: hypothetical protein JRJ44_07085 [Deltaproteobacteria bacterium]|nr:hypothetical protein [Deltaproteobacteria bacterium]